MNPNVRLATKTMAAIDAAIEADQGNLFRQKLGLVLPHIHDIYRQDDDKFRTHLGASMIGRTCARELWYKFRWAHFTRFPGRILRLFNRGHMEEARIIACLLMIGVEVFQQDKEGNQFRISDHGGHFGGSGDGIGIGIPDLPAGVACNLEFKTFKAKLFAKLVADGVRVAKFEHYVQANIYMRKMGIPVCLYIGSCKDDDHFYMEIITLNTMIADQYIERGGGIIFADEPPKKLSNSPGYYECKYCDERTVCHSLGGLVDRNCRTCIESKPLPTGEWRCTMHGRSLTKQEQIAACGDYKARVSST